jgi:hypothetical protein
LEESRVETLHHKSTEVVKCQRLHFGVSDTGSWRSQELRLFITGVTKSRNEKSQNVDLTPFRSSGYQELEVSKHFTTGMLKCKKHLLVQVSNTGSSSVETLHHRNTEIPECRNAKNTFWCRFWIPGVGVSRYFSTGMLKREITKALYG